MNGRSERLFLAVCVAVCLSVSVLASACRPAQRLPALDALMESEVAAEHVAGAVVQVKQGDRLLHRAAYGFAQRYAYGAEPLDPPDTMTAAHHFDLASLTKVFGTTFAVMLLVDRGAIDLDAPVRVYLPAFSGGDKDQVTVRHLLTHTAGLTQWWPLYYVASNRDETAAAIAAMPLQFQVGQGRHYSDLGFMLLGYLVEHVTGQDLDAFLAAQLFGPLGLEHTTYRPLTKGIDASQVAATSSGNPFERHMVVDDAFGYDVDVDPASWDGWRHYTLRGEVNDGNAFYANEGVAGHAGLFSTVDDLQVLVDLLLGEGRFGGAQIIDAGVIREFLTPDATGNGLGWGMEPEVYIAADMPEGTFGHTGFTGTNVLIVPALDLSILILTNRQNVGPASDGTYYNLNPTRRRVAEIVLNHVRRP